MKIITICSSASFYKDVIEISEQLKKLGYKVKIPKTANVMKRGEDYNVDNYKTWYKNPEDYGRKRALMNDHFKKVLESDGILVYNKTKKGIKGYIGGNVLLEMFLAYQNKKPIFLWESIGENSQLLEEALSFKPIIIDHDLSRIRVH